MVEYPLTEMFEQVAMRVPDRTAIAWREQRVSYGRLLERTRRVAAMLRAVGAGQVRPRGEIERWESGQQHVAIVMRNRPEWLEILLGALAARTVPCNVNYRFVARELAPVLAMLDPVAVVFERGFGDVIAEALGDHSPLLLEVTDESDAPALDGAIDFERALRASSPTGTASDPSPDDIYGLLTGGTTGAPKMVLWRQADIYAAAIVGQRPTRSDRGAADPLQALLGRLADAPRPALAAAPYMHGAAQWNAISTLLRADTVLIQSVVDRLDADDIWRTLERHGATSLAIVGDAFGKPLLAALERGQYELGRLRFVFSGGVALSAPVKAGLLRRLPGVTVIDTAGSSETGTQLTEATERGDAPRAGHFTPAAGTCLLNHDRTRVLAVGDPEPGWLARAGSVPLGYLGDPARTRATFPEIGGIRYAVPGDRAQYDPDGSIALLGRDSLTINSGGEKIFAEEVEAALKAHPDVDDALVVGRQSDRWGQEVVAVVQTRPGAAIDRASFRASEIAAYKLPKAIFCVPQIRRSPAGKADYQWAMAIVTERSLDGTRV
jgi:acyl-CoA synthetase (AMP-forming)/AMP-acid ligase II